MGGSFSQWSGLLHTKGMLASGTKHRRDRSRVRSTSFGLLAPEGFKIPASGSPLKGPGRPSAPSLCRVALTGAQATWTWCGPVLLGALPARSDPGGSGLPASAPQSLWKPAPCPPGPRFPAAQRSCSWVPGHSPSPAGTLARSRFLPVPHFSRNPPETPTTETAAFAYWVLMSNPLPHPLPPSPKPVPSPPAPSLPSSSGALCHPGAPRGAQSPPRGL